jgi:hypothetical protein
LYAEGTSGARRFEDLTESPTVSLTGGRLTVEVDDRRIPGMFFEEIFRRIVARRLN